MELAIALRERSHRASCERDYPIWGMIFFSSLDRGPPGRGSMTDNNPTEFVCPGCGSSYKVVRVEADADLPHRLLHCRVCKHPLTAMDGEFLLKYFLVRPSE
jgi:hypothetical protein